MASASSSSSSSSSSALLPVLSSVVGALDVIDLVSASSVCRQWREHSRPVLDRARARLRARDEVLSCMRDLPDLDDYLFYPAAGRLHVFRSPGTKPPTAWLILLEVVGWSDEDETGECSEYLGVRYTVANSSPNAQPPPDALDPDCMYMSSYGVSQAERTDRVGLLTTDDLGPFDEEEDEDGDEGPRDQEEFESEFGTCSWSYNIEGLHPALRFVQLRGGCYPLSRDAAWYAERGVGPNAAYPELERPGAFGEHGITGPGLLRALVAEHRDELFGSKRQLRRLFNPAVKLRPLLCLDDWYHADHTRSSALTSNSNGRVDYRPRCNPTFRAIAQCIADGSAVHYHRAVEAGRLPPPNTHWKYWKQAGYRL